MRATRTGTGTGRARIGSTASRWASLALGTALVGTSAGSCRPTGATVEATTREPTLPGPPQAGNAGIADALAVAAALDRPVAFPDVVRAATGHSVIPLNPSTPTGSAIADAVAEAASSVARSMGEPGSPVRGLGRINEASRHFEDALAATLDAHPEFSCHPAATTAGRTQRTGYPDLELVHLPSGATTYLDPKLFESGSESSSLRTFYYQPAAARNKVTTDAHHLVVGFGHDGNDGEWRFTSWHLVDLSGLEVELKAEFHAGNRDLYGDDRTTISNSVTAPQRPPPSPTRDLTPPPSQPDNARPGTNP